MFLASAQGNLLGFAVIGLVVLVFGGGLFSIWNALSERRKRNNIKKGEDENTS